jgi:flavin-dependent dehydrogenase
LVGDAFGFVDPMLSPGVFLAMWSADRLARALTPTIRSGIPPGPALDRYTTEFHAMLAAWTELIDSIYEGRLFGLYRVGSDMVRTRNSVLTRAMERHIGQNIAGMAAGARTTSRYSRGLVRFLAKHSFGEIDPRDFAVR